MKFVMKLMACKLLRKCHKEESPTGVIATTMQCKKGSLLSLDPYLVNLFLEDCKDAQDLGTEFHYSWLIILMDLIGWGEPKYNGFYQRLGKCHATKYTTLWHTSDPKKMKENSSMFAMLFDEMQEKLDNTWRIPPELVT
jgi:hypothetical protein